MNRIDSPLGSLDAFFHSLREESSMDLSFLNDEFGDLEEWKTRVRARLRDSIPEKTVDGPIESEIMERREFDDYVREKIRFQSVSGSWVPAYVLIPRGVEQPVPGLVCFHDHGGMYYWGKEKIVEIEAEHPVLTAFKEKCYGGRSYATDFCRAGFAVIVIDAFYWGERRLVTDEDVTNDVNDWTLNESAEEIQRINRQSSANEDMAARALYQIGRTWQGIWLRDEVRSLDYLVSRPEVNEDRIGCVGLSIGGFRSAQFAGLESRVKCAVVAGWMTTFAEMFASRPMNTHYCQFITGAYRSVDLPDIVSLCCPGGLMVIHGREDHLFTPKGVSDAYVKIQAVYDKAGVPENVDLRYYDTPHEFNRQMQSDALAWLERFLLDDFTKDTSNE